MTVALSPLLAQTELPDVQQLADAFDAGGWSWWNLLEGASILAVGLVIASLVRRLGARGIERAGSDALLGDLVGRLAGYVVALFGLVYALQSLGIAVAPLLGAMGVVGIALAFALQDILANFLAGVILQLRRPFRSGDEVTLVDWTGRVVRIDARTVTLATPDGESVRLPSADVLAAPIINHTRRGARRTTINVGIAYGTDLDTAVTVANRAMHAVSAVKADPVPETLVANLGASSVELALRFWHDPSLRDRWTTRDEVARKVMAAFAREGINIPFPQRVLHLAPSTDDSSPLKPAPMYP